MKLSPIYVLHHVYRTMKVVHDHKQKTNFDEISLLLHHPIANSFKKNITSYPSPLRDISNTQNSKIHLLNPSN